ncbi:hypothetical protein D3C80_1867330 [compost metagenome]
MLTEVGRECRVFFQNLGYRLTLKLLVKGAQVLIQLRQSTFQECGNFDGDNGRVLQRLPEQIASSVNIGLRFAAIEHLENLLHRTQVLFKISQGCAFIHTRTDGHHVLKPTKLLSGHDIFPKTLQ